MQRRPFYNASRLKIVCLDNDSLSNIDSFYKLKISNLGVASGTTTVQTSLCRVIARDGNNFNFISIKLDDKYSFRL